MNNGHDIHFLFYSPHFFHSGNINKIGSILWWGHIPRLEWKLYYFTNYTEYNKKGIYPVYICSFLKKLYNREKGMISMFKVSNFTPLSSNMFEYVYYT